jgi:hypothetical protein
MNNKTILTMAFLIAGTLLSSTVTMVPAFAGGDDDDDHGRDGDRKDGNYGDGNKQKVEDDSAGALNDCDAIKNEIEDTTFENINECIAIAATDESEVNDGEDGLFPVDGECRGNRIPVTIDGLTLCIPPGFVPR